MLVALLAAFAYVGVVDRLAVEDDAAKTAANIEGSETLFRLAIASLLVVAALDVVVAWALFTVFEPATPILQKLNLRDRVQAVVLAHETRLFV